MKEVELEFVGEWSGDSKDRVEELLIPHLRIVERKMWRISLRVEDADGGAMIMVRRRYHNAHLSFDEKFFDLDPRQQTQMVIHELVHILVDPITRQIDHVLDSYFEADSSIRVLLDTQFEDAQEELTDGVALVLEELFGELGEGTSTTEWKPTGANEFTLAHPSNKEKEE